MIFLHSHSVGTSQAFRIYKTYGDEAIQTVEENPYRLAHDIWGIGFKTADRIAFSLGIEKHSDIRARAGVAWVLQEMTNNGHCAFPRSGLVERAVEILEIPANIIERAVDHEIGAERLSQHTYRGEDLVYLKSLDLAEQFLAMHLMRLSRGSHPCPDLDVDKAAEWAGNKLKLTLAESQRSALRQAVTSKVMVITGGPGVGKTTLINGIVKIFEAKQLKVLLCAPTGRAAKRMSEATGMEAKTIHRLLEFDPAHGKFKHNQEHPLKGDVFIVDEFSMVDVVLAYQLIQAVPGQAALILVGDIDQLPAVGPGNVLNDIISSGVLAVRRLTEVFRQAARSAIITNAHRINEGQFPQWPRTKVASPHETDFYFIEADEPEKGVETILHLVCDRIPKKFGLDPREDIQVLAPMQRGELGARNLNTVLQAALTPPGESVQRYGWTFRVGDKVMQIVNDYDKDVFNGDIGRIESLDTVDREVVVKFEDRKIKYDFEELDELALSFAVTIHKSQGSEYPCVVIPLHTQHYMMLQRNLLYTAVTRGRRLVIVVGTQKALAIAVKKRESSQRITTLQERLQAAGDV